MDDHAVALLDHLISRLAQRRFVGGGNFRSLDAGVHLNWTGRDARGYALVLVSAGQATLGVGTTLMAGDLALLASDRGKLPELTGGQNLRGFWWGFHLGEHVAATTGRSTVEHGCGHLAGLMALGFAECRLNDRWRHGRLADVLDLMLTDLRRRHHHRGEVGRRLTPAQCEAIEAAAANAGPHDVTSTDLARAAGLSRRYFTRLLRATYGVPVRRWILAQRLRRGANLLVFTQRAAADIARELGYADVSLFSRQFKALYGITPLQHRRQPAHAHLDLWAMQRV